MPRHQNQDASHPTTKLVMGVFISVVSAVALVGLVHGTADRLYGHGATPIGFWWGLIVLLGTFLAIGATWMITGIRGTFLPTSLLYRLTDLPGLLERLTGRR